MNKVATEIREAAYRMMNAGVLDAAKTFGSGVKKTVKTHFAGNRKTNEKLQKSIKDWSNSKSFKDYEATRNKQKKSTRAAAKKAWSDTKAAWKK